MNNLMILFALLVSFVVSVACANSEQMFRGVVAVLLLTLNVMAVLFLAASIEVIEEDDDENKR